MVFKCHASIWLDLEKPMVDSLHLIWIKAWEQSNLESQKSDQVEEHQINKLHNGFLRFWNIPQ